jgi:hypothetical protein
VVVSSPLVRQRRGGAIGRVFFINSTLTEAVRTKWWHLLYTKNKVMPLREYLLKNRLSAERFASCGSISDFSMSRRQ